MRICEGFSYVLSILRGVLLAHSVVCCVYNILEKLQSARTLNRIAGDTAPKAVIQWQERLIFVTPIRSEFSNELKCRHRQGNHSANVTVAGIGPLLDLSQFGIKT